MNRKEMFKKQLNYIKNNNYKSNIEILLDLIPEYFFNIPASSTGKYHPAFSLGEGGLVRHTKVAIEFASQILSLESFNDIFTPDEKDLMICALILHDNFKSGVEKQEYTVSDHPLLASNFLKENKDRTTFSLKEIDFLVDIISSHMGEWNTNYKKEEILPKPKTKYEIFVHVCDYLSSRKFLDIKFENNEIIQ